jgi:AmmeMemoRadiSam system protein B
LTSLYNTFNFGVSLLGKNKRSLSKSLLRGFVATFAQGEKVSRYSGAIEAIMLRAIGVFFAFALPVYSQVGTSQSFARPGLFPNNPSVLWEQFGGFIELYPQQQVNGKISAILLPGGNYVIAAGILGSGYRTLQQQSFDEFIIVTHDNSISNGAKIPVATRFTTPLGTVSSNEKFASNLTLSIPSIKVDNLTPPDEFWYQVCFLQRIFHNPVVDYIEIGDVDIEFIDRIAKQISKTYTNKNVCIIGIADLAKDTEVSKVNGIDRQLIIQFGDMAPEKFLESVAPMGSDLDSKLIALLMATAHSLGAKSGKLIKHSTASGFSLSKNRGMASYVWFEGEKVQAPQQKSSTLTAAEWVSLWNIANATIVGGTEPAVPEYLKSAKGGVFISITKKDSVIARVGDLFNGLPLAEAVKSFSTLLMAPNRFNKIDRAALGGAVLTISIADPVEGINLPQPDMGIYIRLGKKIGLLFPFEKSYLPPEIRMEQACSQAGISFKSWCIPETDVHFFKVQAYSHQVETGISNFKK